jgi:hypothetical protein
MRPEDLIFWLDVLTDDHRLERGVLCRRHADSMVVPRGWTLNDMRDPHLHLFRPPPRPPAAASRSRRRRPDPPTRDETGQLALDAILDVDEASTTTAGPDEADSAPSTEITGSDDSVAMNERQDATDVGGDAARWTPEFDDRDDLDGLLSASSPLLARAFRIIDRPS